MIALHAWQCACGRGMERAKSGQAINCRVDGYRYYHHRYEYPTFRFDGHGGSLIGLHDLVARDIPESFRDKLVTLRQSAAQPAVRGGSRPESGQFNICVIGHLRDEKDSLRAALAARHLPEDSSIVVNCAGRPHTEEWCEKVLAESKDNPRFHWLGELDNRVWKT